MVYLMKGKALSKGTKRKRNIEESDDPSVMSSDNSVFLSKTSPDESDTVATNDSTNNIFKDNVSLEKKRDEIIEGTLFINDKSNVYTLVGSDFNEVDKRAQKEGEKKISDSDIVISSQIPTILPSTKEPLTKALSLFCSYWIVPNTLEIIVDLRSSDFYTVPLKDVVIKTDRQFIVHLSQERASIRDQDGIVHKEKYYTAFCNTISRPRNKFLREILVKFFQRYFDEESTKLLKNDLASKNKTMKAIVIYDRKNSAVPKLRTENTIITAICFSNEPKQPILYIDYVATNENFVRGSFASMIMNTVQHCGILYYQHENITTEPMMTFLNCIPPLSDVYTNYGFTLCNLEEMRNPEHSLHCVYIHFECKDWHKIGHPDSEQPLVVMCCDKILPRWTNLLNYELNGVEKYIFNNENTDKSTENSNHKQLDPGTEYAIKSIFTAKLKSIVNSVRYRKFTEGDILEYQSSQGVSKYVYNIMKKKQVYIDIGEIFNDCFDSYKHQENLYSEKVTLLTKEMIKELSIRIIPDSRCYTQEDSNCFGMWFEFKCKKCKQSCFLRKKDRIKIDRFLIKAIYSRWTTHVFGLVFLQSDHWNKCNPKWNHCKSRTKNYFNSLKNAIIQDSTKQSKTYNTTKSYIVQCTHIQVIAKMLFEHHKNLLLAWLAVGVDIREHLKEDRKKSNLTNEERNQQLIRDIGVTKSLVSRSKPTKMQNKEDVSVRYAAEKKWKGEYYNDLTIQQRLRRIGFVDPTKIVFDKLLPDSQAYVKYHRSDKYKKKKNSDPTVKTDLSHFIGVTDSRGGFTRNNKGNDHVIDENYFQPKNEMGKITEPRRISAKTIRRCYQNPNKLHQLNNADRKAINKHAASLLCAGEIQKVRLLEEKCHKVETLLFKGKRFESKIRFEGVDSRDRVHYLSDDWLKLNFGEEEKFLNHILTMAYTGIYVNVPPGRRKKKMKKYPFSKKDQGPPIKYQQVNESSCLFCSVASAFHLLEKPEVAQKIMSVYYKKIKRGKVFSRSFTHYRHTSEQV